MTIASFPTSLPTPGLSRGVGEWRPSSWWPARKICFFLSVVSSFFRIVLCNIKNSNNNSKIKQSIKLEQDKPRPTNKNWEQQKRPYKMTTSTSSMWRDNKENNNSRNGNNNQDDKALDHLAAVTTTTKTTMKNNKKLQSIISPGSIWSFLPTEEEGGGEPRRC